MLIFVFFRNTLTHPYHQRPSIYVRKRVSNSIHDSSIDKNRDFQKSSFECTHIFETFSSILLKVGIHGDAMKRIQTKTVVANKMARARSAELLCATEVLVAPLIGEFGTRLKGTLLRLAHGDHILGNRNCRAKIMVLNSVVLALLCGRWVAVNKKRRVLEYDRLICLYGEGHNLTDI